MRKGEERTSSAPTGLTCIPESEEKRVKGRILSNLSKVQLLIYWMSCSLRDYATYTCLLHVWFLVRVGFLRAVHHV